MYKSQLQIVITACMLIWLKSKHKISFCKKFIWSLSLQKVYIRFSSWNRKDCKLTLAAITDLLTKDIKSWHHKSTKTLASGTNHRTQDDDSICSLDTVVKPKYWHKWWNSDSVSFTERKKIYNITLINNTKSSFD